MKVGRNDPCPCGSGKKYKKCCMNKETGPSQTLYYQRLSEAHDRLVARLMPFATRVFGEEAVGVAMYDFFLRPETEDTLGSDAFDRVMPLFWPWFLFNWEYDAQAAEMELPGPEGRTVAELYAEKHGHRLDRLQQNLIENINRQPYSFWEVLHVDKGQGLGLQDVLEGSRIEVHERSGSAFLHAGDLVYGRAVSVDGVGMIIGLGPTIIPPGRKTDIIELRKMMRPGQSSITSQTLAEWEYEIRDLYFSLDHSLHSPPQICNTDGDPLEMHRLVYEISSAEEAFNKLCGLCVTMSPEEIRAEAKQDDSGCILRVEFPWDRQGHKVSSGMDNTILGHIEIKGHRLTAQVNSKQRAEAFRREMKARLDDSARFKVDEIQDLTSIMDGPREKGPEMGKSSRHDELMQDPEIQKQIAEMLARHWEDWINQGIPALGGQTPWEAVTSADGREAVESLLLEAERHRGRDPFTVEGNRLGVRRVRELLGLNEPPK